MNTNHSNKILEVLYKRVKDNLKGNDAFLPNYNYDVKDILIDANLSEEDAKPFLDILSREKGYIEWDNIIVIRLTTSGWEHCLEIFERPKFGFVK